MDNTILIIIIVLAMVVIPAALLLKKTRKTRSAGEDHIRRQRLDYQPAQKPIPVATPVPVFKPVQKQRPAPPLPEAEVWENCQDLRQCLLALEGKYSLDSFTIATSDGLVFATSGGATAQDDAAGYSGKYTRKMPGNMVLFSLNHKGSELTGIIRTRGTITGETQNRIENDTKDILDKWI